MSLLQRFVLLVILLSSNDGTTAFFVNNKPQQASSKSSTSKNPVKVKIEVCQNKDCCKRFQGKFTLVETLQDLLVHNNGSNNNVEITSSGCLSHCGKGPNVCVSTTTTNNEKKEIHGIVNAVTASTTLQHEFNEIIPTIPSTLLAAVTVMERSQKKEMSWEQQEKFLNSVIKTLQQQPKKEGQEEDLSQSVAIAHAYCLRAKMYMSRPAVAADTNYDQLAKQDANMAIQIILSSSKLTTTTTSSSSSSISPWRLSIDIEKRQLSKLTDANDKTTKVQEIIQIYQQWAKVNPSFRTKINNEIQELLESI